jgi:hypothetical protein
MVARTSEVDQTCACCCCPEPEPGPEPLSPSLRQKHLIYSSLTQVNSFVDVKVPLFGDTFSHVDQKFKLPAVAANTKQ